MKRLPHIIGITGYAQHGKDSIAQVLRYELGYERHGFADQLKEMALAVDPIIGFLPEEATEITGGSQRLRLSHIVNRQGWEIVKRDFSEARRFLQVLGTEGVRGVIGEGAWIEALAKKIGAYDPHFADKARIVVPDVRFVNESEWIRRMGGEIWKVERYDSVWEQVSPYDDGRYISLPFDNGVGQDHPSEREIPQICADITFMNDGTLEELQTSVFAAIFSRGVTA